MAIEMPYRTKARQHQQEPLFPLQGAIPRILSLQLGPYALEWATQDRSGGMGRTRVRLSVKIF